MADNRDIIRERILEEIDKKFDKQTGSWIFEFAQSLGIELENKYVENEDALRQKFAGTADLESLKIIAFERGVTWKDATYATGVVEVKGVPNALINKGDLFSNKIVEYEAIENKTIDSDGRASVRVKCTVKGTVGNTIADTITEFPKTLEGLNEVTNPLPIENGYPEETREELLLRFYNTIRRPATSGNIYHYLNWAESIKGVGNAKVKPLWNGNGTVKVIIIDREKEPASEELIKEVKDYIETVRPIGADVTVSTAEILKIDLECQVQLMKDYTLEQVTANIKEDLKNYYKEIAFTDMDVYIAKVASIIFNATGVNNLDINTLKLNGEKNDIILVDNNEKTEIPQLGELTITV